MSGAKWIGREVYGGEPSRDLPASEARGVWSLEAIWETGRPHDLAVSPDGGTVGFVLDLDGTYDIWTVDLNGDRSRITNGRAVTAFWDDSAPAFSPEGSRLAYADDGWVHVVDLDGGNEHSVVKASLGAWLDESHLIVIVDVGLHSRLAVAGLDGGDPVMVGPEGGQVVDPTVTDDGRILATYYPSSDMNRSDVVLVERDGSWETFAGHPDRRAYSARAMGSRVVYALETADRTALFLANLDSGEHVALAEGDFDLEPRAWATDGGSIIAVALRRGRADLVRVGLDGELVVVAKGGVWGDPVAVEVGIVATHESWQSPPRMVHITGDGGLRDLYTGAPPALGAATSVGFDRVTFVSLDGLEIEGFLTRPSGVSGRVPVILYAHGGPTDFYGDEWDGHAQHFVEKGYGWMGINFRGSTTYGLEFERANHGTCGVADADDCVAAGNFLAGLDWVDPTRMVIFGPSYGAYLTVAVLGRDDNPFACGVAKYGDYDMFTSWEQTDVVGHDEFLRLFGHPDDNPDVYRAGSPILGVPNIQVPLLFIHGEKDPRTHYKQAEELLEALQLHGKHFEFVSYPDEAHGLLHREPQLDFYGRMGRFLDWHTAIDRT